MKRMVLFVLVLMLGVCGRVPAQILMGSYPGDKDPPDDVTTWWALQPRPEVKARQTNYQRLLQLWIEPLTLADMTNFFGPKLAAPPTDLALPLGASTAVSLPGIRSGNPADNKAHTDWYALGANGYAEVFFRNNDGTTVQNAVVFARMDEHFVRLNSEADFTNRLAWDQAKLDDIGRWMEQRLPKATDLGELNVPVNEQTGIGSVPPTMEEGFAQAMGARYWDEVNAASKTNVALGDGRKCVICVYKGTTYVGGRAAFYFVHVWLDSPPEATQKEKQGALLTADYDDEKIRMQFDGKFYDVMLHLKAPQ